ncbi:WecB/TagA/CpsF family glycosyltransferase [Catalinimonas sp. 4WD22]|uniref:WecB/TagA/CpsF family glycosyltransferase n=1 Tax=Catalinimonas locisalis TaxID=3133978 RepID=UPI003101021C
MTQTTTDQAISNKKVINSNIATLSFQEAVDHIFYLAEHKSSSFVCFANVHMIVEAFKDHYFQEVINQADLALPDGLPLTKYIGIFENTHQDRVAGPDTMPEIMKRAAMENKSVYFYGGSDFMLHMMVERAREELPQLNIAGAYAPPYRPLTREEDKQIVEKINNVNPDFVFVCLGCPKQENWMHRHKDKIKSCMLGVGQAFTIYAGLEERAPEWAQKNCLEWAYRLYREPKRLARRYIYTNAVFLYLVSRLYFRKLRKKELLPI